MRLNATVPRVVSQGDFLITGGVTFGPSYVPTRFSVTKERNIDRKENFCGTEDVSDTGSKNRELHISGAVLETELHSFTSLLDHNGPLDIITPGWSGEIRVEQGEYEGPLGTDPRSGKRYYKYSLDVVSTGADEPGENHGDDGVLSTGDNPSEDTRVTTTSGGDVV